MKILISLLFAFYACCDTYVLHIPQKCTVRFRIGFAFCAVFSVLAGWTSARCVLPVIHQYSPDELCTIALLFVILYQLETRTKRFAVLKELEASALPENIVLTLSLCNEFGFGFLSGFQNCELYWMVLLTFLFHIFLSEHNSELTKNILSQKSFSLALLASMILLIQLSN